MNVVCYERVSYECGLLRTGLLWTWSVMKGSSMIRSVTNVVSFECSVMSGLLWTGLFWTDTGDKHIIHKNNLQWVRIIAKTRGCCCNFSVGVALKVWFSYGQCMKMTRDERVLGFKSCDISIYWWIWILSFLLKQIWIGIDYFLLNFFARFGSILGLQITVGMQVSTGLQPPTRWEPFIVDTMMRRPESTKERVELTILSIIPIEITHLTRFTLLLLLWILRYMRCNHVAHRHHMGLG